MADLPSIPVVIAEDEWHYREALAAALSRVPDIRVVAACETAEASLAAVAEARPAVALVDLELPQMGGLELSRRIQADHPETAVVIFTVSRQEEHVLEALRAGASGYLIKQETTDAARLAEAIRIVASGGTLLSTRAARELVQRLARRPPPDPAAEYGLTRREREVLALLTEGASNRQIGGELNITEQAVKNHVGSILRKLDAPNRTAAAATARREGLAP